MPTTSTRRNRLPPYARYAAVQNALRQIAERGLEPVRPECLAGVSTGYARVMILALEFLGFLRPDGSPTEVMREWAAHPPRRAAIFAKALRRAYRGWPRGWSRIAPSDIPAVIGPLRCSPAVRRKAERFLEDAAADLGLLRKDDHPSSPVHAPGESPEPPVEIPASVAAIVRKMVAHWPHWTPRRREAALRALHVAIMRSVVVRRRGAG
ncbi:MAG: DUF5343 domain-containing protein [Firmicutes bacterium]|nr:DUF5343 domain-containing protein [Bacillota bacterium]